MPSRAQLLAIAEWDMSRFKMKPPRSAAELGISERDIAAGWAQYQAEEVALREECLRRPGSFSRPETTSSLMPSSAEVAPAPRASGRAAPAPRKPRRSVARLALGMLFGMLGGMLCMAATPKPLDALHAGNCPTQLDFGNAAPPAPALALAKASALGCGDCCFELLPQHFGADGGQGGWGERAAPYSGFAPPIRCARQTASAALPDAKCFLPLMEPCRHFVFAVAESGRELQVRQQVQHRADVLCVSRGLCFGGGDADAASSRGGVGRCARKPPPFDGLLVRSGTPLRPTTEGRAAGGKYSRVCRRISSAFLVSPASARATDTYTREDRTRPKRTAVSTEGWRPPSETTQSALVHTNGVVQQPFTSTVSSYQVLTISRLVESVMPRCALISSRYEARGSVPVSTSVQKRETRKERQRHREERARVRDSAERRFASHEACDCQTGPRQGRTRSG